MAFAILFFASGETSFRTRLAILPASWELKCARRALAAVDSLLLTHKSVVGSTAHLLFVVLGEKTHLLQKK
jgi:hypothetical protein